MKTLQESLLDIDFDGPDFNIDPIKPNIPILDDDSWKMTVEDANKHLESLQHYTEINNLISAAQELYKTLRGVRFNAADSNMNRLVNWVDDAGKLKPLDAQEILIRNNINNIRVMNDWLGKVNKVSEFKKCAMLGGDLFVSIHERTYRGQTIYAAIQWNFMSPNENGQAMIRTAVDKLNKIDRNIDVTFSMNQEGMGLVVAKLMKDPNQ